MSPELDPVFFFQWCGLDVLIYLSGAHTQQCVKFLSCRSALGETAVLEPSFVWLSWLCQWSTFFHCSSCSFSGCLLIWVQCRWQLCRVVYATVWHLMKRHKIGIITLTIAKYCNHSVFVCVSEHVCVFLHPDGAKSAISNCLVLKWGPIGVKSKMYITEILFPCRFCFY